MKNTDKSFSFKFEEPITMNKYKLPRKTFWGKIIAFIVSTIVLGYASFLLEKVPAFSGDKNIVPMIPLFIALLIGYVVFSSLNGEKENLIQREHSDFRYSVMKEIKKIEQFYNSLNVYTIFDTYETTPFRGISRILTDSLEETLKSKNLDSHLRSGIVRVEYKANNGEFFHTRLFLKFYFTEVTHESCTIVFSLEDEYDRNKSIDFDQTLNNLDQWIDKDDVEYFKEAENSLTAIRTKLKSYIGNNTIDAVTQSKASSLLDQATYALVDGVSLDEKEKIVSEVNKLIEGE